jgi:hypothetical protein
LPAALRPVVERSHFCRLGPCVLTLIDEKRAVLVGKPRPNTTPGSLRLGRRQDGSWAEYDPSETSTDAAPPALQQLDLGAGKVEVRSVERRQLFIDGVPVGEVFE